MKNIGAILSFLAMCYTHAAFASEYKQSMKCTTIKGPAVGYNSNGKTFNVMSVTDGDEAPVFKVVGEWSPGSAHPVLISDAKGWLKEMILTEPEATFLQTPTFVKIDGQYYVTSARFKLKSKMRTEFRGEIKGEVSKTEDHGLSVEEIQHIKENIDSILDKAISEQIIDSEIECSMTGVLK